MTVDELKKIIDDLREKEIRDFQSEADRTVARHEGYTKACQDLMDWAGREQEGEKQDWIPASERLPDTRKPNGEPNPVMVTYLGWHTNRPETSITAVYDSEEKAWRWYDETEEWEDMPLVRVRITAWQPLPKPYREGDCQDLQNAISEEGKHVHQ